MPLLTDRPIFLLWYVFFKIAIFRRSFARCFVSHFVSSNSEISGTSSFGISMYRSTATTAFVKKSFNKTWDWGAHRVLPERVVLCGSGRTSVVRCGKRFIALQAILVKDSETLGMRSFFKSFPELTALPSPKRVLTSFI